MATTLGIEFGGWGFEKLPLRVQKMILRQIRIAPGADVPFCIISFSVFV
jgi:hypothetical protein